MTLVHVLVGVYLAGVAIGLMVMRDRWPVRLLTAALWPLGLVAFAVVVTMFVAAAFYLWPIPVLVTAAVIAAIWMAA